MLSGAESGKWAEAFWLSRSTELTTEQALVNLSRLVAMVVNPKGYEGLQVMRELASDRLPQVQALVDGALAACEVLMAVERDLVRAEALHLMGHGIEHEGLVRYLDGALIEFLSVWLPTDPPTPDNVEGQVKGTVEGYRYLFVDDWAVPEEFVERLYLAMEAMVETRNSDYVEGLCVVCRGVAHVAGEVGPIPCLACEGTGRLSTGF